VGDDREQLGMATEHGGGVGNAGIVSCYEVISKRSERISPLSIASLNLVLQNFTLSNLAVLLLFESESVLWSVSHDIALCQSSTC
jgi:hypothetical protein